MQLPRLYDFCSVRVIHCGSLFSSIRGQGFDSRSVESVGEGHG